MFLLGHLGIGERLARPFVSENCRAALFLGCVLPDLIDKPLYYGLSFATGKHAAELGLISSTRTLGHSLLFALGVFGLASFWSRPRAKAVFAGMLTHLALDLTGDAWGKCLELLGWSSVESTYERSPHTVAAILFPLLGPHFPVAPFHSFAEHAKLSTASSYVVFGELLGGALLFLDWRARQRLNKGFINNG
jgi:hypothetical protein